MPSLKVWIIITLLVLVNLPLLIAPFKGRNSVGGWAISDIFFTDAAIALICLHLHKGNRLSLKYIFLISIPLFLLTGYGVATISADLGLNYENKPYWLLVYILVFAAGAYLALGLQILDILQWLWSQYDIWFYRKIAAPVAVSIITCASILSAVLSFEGHVLAQNVPLLIWVWVSVATVLIFSIGLVARNLLYDDSEEEEGERPSDNDWTCKWVGAVLYLFGFAPFTIFWIVRGCYLAYINFRDVIAKVPSPHFLVFNMALLWWVLTPSVIIFAVWLPRTVRNLWTKKYRLVQRSSQQSREL